MTQPPITITADEVNCLIHAYFEDSGFQHSAFVLRAEGQLDRSPHINKHVARGELVYLLSKALLYTEVEAHWRGNAMTSNCKAPFSLLDQHTCSLDPNLPPIATFNPPIPPEAVPVSLNGTTEKRKGGALEVDESQRNKRARTEDSMDLDSTTSTAPQTKPSTPVPLMPIDGALSVAQRHPRTRPPEEITDLNAVSLLKGHKTEVFVCAWNPVDANKLATGSKDTIVHLWNLHPSEGGGPITSDPPLALDNLSKTTQGDITSLDWNPAGTLLAVGSYNATLQVCTPSSELYFSREQHEKGPIFATRFSKSGRWLLTASLDGSVCVWDIPAKELHRQYKNHEACCLDVDWISDDLFASCGADGKIHVLRLKSAVPVKTLIGHASEVNQIKFNSSKGLLASCSDDHTARIWSMHDLLIPDAPAMPAKVLEGHEGTVSSVMWQPKTPEEEHALLATASFDTTCRLWDTATGECLHVFRDHQLSIYTLSWSADARLLATGSGDGWVHIYDVKTHERKWSWSAGDRIGIFEIDWEQHGDVDRLALALQNFQVGIIDASRIPALKSS
ncbi:unnamed protein product [Somion occarium]|uniref:WD40 repeat-like protein n=1 Tax=Somion occarium TaxID=3059160 RepID=A0ABP1CEQ0_9APHY